jgi:hypothetical protein
VYMTDFIEGMFVTIIADNVECCALNKLNSVV